MKNTVANSSANQLASNVETLQSFPKWMKVVAIFYLVMIPFILYHREWATLCILMVTLLTMLGRKEQQMSRLVKVVWVTATLAFIIAGWILYWGRWFSPRR